MHAHGWEVSSENTYCSLEDYNRPPATPMPQIVIVDDPSLKKVIFSSLFLSLRHCLTFGVCVAYAREREKKESKLIPHKSDIQTRRVHLFLPNLRAPLRYPNPSAPNLHSSDWLGTYVSIVWSFCPSVRTYVRTYGHDGGGCHLCVALIVPIRTFLTAGPHPLQELC